MAVRAGWRFRIGVTIFVAGFAAPLGIPLVVASELPAAWKTVLSGALAIGLPEVMMVVAAAVMGKEGFAELKDRFGRFFKKYGPPERVSLTRYRVGLLMFSLPLLLAWWARTSDNTYRATIRIGWPGRSPAMRSSSPVSLSSVGGSGTNCGPSSSTRPGRFFQQRRATKEPKMSNTEHASPARRQLERLTILTDVVYGVALVLVVTWLPLPEESHSGGVVWLADLWAEYSNNIIGVVIGLVFTIIYWLRSNTLMTTLDRTDGVHTGLSIASVFFLLVLLYIVRVSADVAAPSSRAGQSVAVALIGIAAGAAWWWARRKNLVRDGITVKEKLGVQIEAFAEPLTALVTLPFAFVGELAWNLAWCAYIPIAAFLGRRGVED